MSTAALALTLLIGSTWDIRVEGMQTKKVKESVIKKTGTTNRLRFGKKFECILIISEPIRSEHAETQVLSVGCGRPGDWAMVVNSRPCSRALVDEPAIKALVDTHAGALDLAIAVGEHMFHVTGKCTKDIDV